MAAQMCAASTVSARVAAPVRGTTHMRAVAPSVAAPARLAARRSAVLGASTAKTLVARAPRATVVASGATTVARLHWWEGAGGMQEYLRDKMKVPMVPCDVVSASVDKGETVLLDVREPEDYRDVHAVSAVNIPLYFQLEGMSFKRFVYAVNGMKGSQLNEKFLEQVQAKFPDKGQSIAVMCNSGGTYEASLAGVEGKKSRSLIAIYQMMKDAGYTNVIHVSGGMREWGAADMPVVGEDIEAWAKKASMMP